MSVQEWLTWVASGLGANVIVSFLAERWAWFQAQTIDAKRWLSFGTSLVLSVGAYSLITYVPAEFWASISPYWQIVVGAFGAYFGVQIFHSFDKFNI